MKRAATAAGTKRVTRDFGAELIQRLVVFTRDYYQFIVLDRGMQDPFFGADGAVAFHQGVDGFLFVDFELHQSTVTAAFVDVHDGSCLDCPVEMSEALLL
tara:strand:+ start:41 stop:340 length:300 start_codon:yes stop_codon:yes gene_type:complete